MPYIMGLEGPRVQPPSLFGFGASASGDECCWHCPCASNVCCDSSSATSRAYAAMRRVAARAPQRQLRGVFSPVTSRPILAVGALLFGAWLAGSKSGQKLVRRVRGR